MVHERAQTRELAVAEPDEDPLMEHREPIRRRGRHDYPGQCQCEHGGVGILPVLKVREEPDEEVWANDGGDEQQEADE